MESVQGEQPQAWRISQSHRGGLRWPGCPWLRQRVFSSRRSRVPHFFVRRPRQQGEAQSTQVAGVRLDVNQT
jgi:hypothetical protein